MAALRGVWLSEVLHANMKNIQEVYRINMEGQFQKKNNGNGVEWLSGASKENDLESGRGLHINMEVGEKMSAELPNGALRELNGQAAVPGWLGGDAADDDSEGWDSEGSCDLQGAGEEKGVIGMITGMSQSSQSENKFPSWDLSPPSSSPMSSPTSSSGTMREAEAVVKGEYLSLRQGPYVELLGVDKFRELVNSYGILATIICSFLNGREGGELYIGVRKSGEVVGVALTRKQRDDVRQVVDRVVSQMIVPRLPTMLVEGRPLVVSRL